MADLTDRDDPNEIARREIAAIRRRLGEGIDGAEDWCADALINALRDARDDVEFLLRQIEKQTTSEETSR